MGNDPFAAVKIVVKKIVNKLMLTNIKIGVIV